MSSESELIGDICSFIHEKNLKPHDVCFLKVFKNEIDLACLHRVANLLNMAAGGRIYLVQLNKDNRIERFTEEEMNQMGWYRKEQL